MSLSIASSTTGPVGVDFSVAAAAATKSQVSKLKVDHPDATLIQACINFAIAMRGASGAFEVDPTVDCDLAQAADKRLMRQASKEQSLIAATRPSTLDGLRAKAAIVDMALDLDRDDMSFFLRSLAADVIRFHRAATEPTDCQVAP
jgi:hypothetical protein